MEVLKEIGKGAYGSVYSLANNKNYALKKLHDVNKRDSDMIRSILLEISSMSLLNHPNIMKCRGFMLSSKSIEYYMKRYPMSLMNFLNNFISKKKYIPTSTINNMLIDILSGIDYLHINNILHLDISDDNIMLDENLRCVITDFGLSDITHPSIFFDTNNKKQKFPVFKNPFASPEVLNESYYELSSDIWAFGILMARMFNYKYIFNNVNNRDDQKKEIVKYLEFNVNEKLNFIKNWMEPREIDYEGIYAVETDITPTHINILLAIFVEEIEHRPSAKQIMSYLNLCEISPKSNIENHIDESNLRYYLIDTLNRDIFDINKFKLVSRKMKNELNFSGTSILE